MFYRRKIILALMQLFEGELEKIHLQKLLFLVAQKQENKAYDFVPYRFGCYSYSANADLTAMASKGILAETNSHFKSLDKTDYLKSLKETDRKQILEIKKLYGGMSTNALMKHTYINFPYWATKSEKAESILTKVELEKVKNSIPVNNKTVLFTIGYEGISLEEYLNRLLKNDVKILVDVRNNPLSMKYGFNKNQLKRFCENLGIQYMHFPEVGIQSEQRQELNTQTDYDKLFTVYRKNNLTKTVPTQTTILNLLKQHKRIALTCFEANICQCHRKHLAEAIESLPSFEYEVKHI
ncbi:MAG: DUF488 domain-containing protein [Bacteroidetes bacterium]|nr:DUF488 domain-containing protein [Bacteroidota bacterium]